MNKTAKTLLIIFLFLGTTSYVNAQLQNLLNDAQKEVSTLSGKKGGIGLSSTDIAEGLSQALQVGAKNATEKVSANNGFFGNSLIKILMPPEVKNVEAKLRSMGMGDQVDKAILSMNRGAEDASKKAIDIFINAIKGMTIEDGLSILQGNKDAATQFLKNKTSAALTQAFLPVIKASLDKVGATKYWADIFRIYNGIPFVQKVNTDLPAYVTQRALAGVFVYIAEEEGKIRTNPEARVNDILKKVFGK